MILVERHKITATPEIIALCTNSKLLYNKCNYFIRKAYFGNKTLPQAGELAKLVRYEEFYKNLHNTKTAMQTIRQLLSDWNNYFKALKAYDKFPEKFLKQPKPPNYKKKLAQVIFFSETIKSKPLKQGIVKPTNNCFSIKSDKKFKQVVITPKTFGFIVEVQYEKEEIKTQKTEHVLNIDPGLINLCAITSDQFSPILINGRIIKSINQWFNKRPNKSRSKKRYFRLENYMHHASKMIISLCVQHRISRIIIGHNDGWKQKINLGKKTNQSFHYVPFSHLFEKIKYKALLVGIEVIMTEESYTSKASFLDRDPLPTYEAGVEHVFSGKRVSRGMYIASDGRKIHSDVQGSLNVGRKVIGDKVYAFPDRSIVAMPVRVNPLEFFCIEQQ